MVSSAFSRFRFVDKWYESQFKHKEGADKYYWENLPFWGKLHAFRQGAKRAQDYYDRTGKSDYYGDHWASDSLNSVLGSVSAPIPGLRLPTMAKSLAKMYGAEVELNIAKYRHAITTAQRYNQDRWFEYQRRKKYNDW